MERLTEAECRQRWNEAIRARGWEKSKLRFAMFDYRTSEHGRTLYHPVPAWPTIADGSNTADAEDYTRVERGLLAQGEPHSRRGAASRAGRVVLEMVASPLPVRRGDVVATIETVMATVHPLAVTQEQILRAAFFAHLPRGLAESLGTAKSAVHPERPTPSSNLVVTGTRGTGMRARYDLGVGHPTESDGITGATELKGGLATLDRLEALCRFDEESAADVQLASGETEKLEEPLQLDLLKLLDPKLTADAFRVSWIASGKRGWSTTAEIRDRAVRIVERVANELNLSGARFENDPATGWLVCSWAQPNVPLELAWYRPGASDPEKYEAVFAAPA